MQLNAGSDSALDRRSIRCTGELGAGFLSRGEPMGLSLLMDRLFRRPTPF